MKLGPLSIKVSLSVEVKCVQIRVPNLFYTYS